MRADTQQSAAIYCRVSTARQEDEGTSLQTQEAACHRYAATHGFNVAAVYQETHTGTDLWERPRLTELRQAIRTRAVDAVIAYSIDRLSRDPVHLGVIISEADHAGVTVAFVTEPLDDSPEGQLIRFVRGYAAKVEHEKIKERTMRGRKARADAGKYLAGNRPPYGYRWTDESKSRLAPDPVTAAIVRRLFREIAAGGTARGLAARLTAEGIPTPTNKTQWSVPTIAQIIRHPVYIGEPRAFRYRWTKERGKLVRRDRPESEQVALPDAAPALVTAEIAAAASSQLTRNKSESTRRNRNPEAALLRAGYARCGYCGHALSATNTSTHGTRYKCNSANRDSYGCPHFAIQAEVLDTMVWARVEEILKRPDIIAGEVARLQRDDPTLDDIASVDRRIADLGRRERNLMTSLAEIDDADTRALIAADLTALATQRRQLRTEREQIEQQRESWRMAQERLDDLTTWCETVAANLGELTYEQRRLALRALGVEVLVWRANHTPRVDIKARIPILSTSSFSSNRSRT